MRTAGGEKNFNQFFRKVVKRTCKEWGFDVPNDEYYLNVCERLPLGLRKIIASGLASGIIADAGLSKSKSAAFRPVGVPETKGPYS